MERPDLFPSEGSVVVRISLIEHLLDRRHIAISELPRSRALPVGRRSGAGVRLIRPTASLYASSGPGTSRERLSIRPLSSWSHLSPRTLASLEAWTCRTAKPVLHRRTSATLSELSGPAAHQFQLFRLLFCQHFLDRGHRPRAGFGHDVADLLDLILAQTEPARQRGSKSQLPLSWRIPCSACPRPHSERAPRRGVILWIARPHLLPHGAGSLRHPAHSSSATETRSLPPDAPGLRHDLAAQKRQNRSHNDQKCPFRVHIRLLSNWLCPVFCLCRCHGSSDRTVNRGASEVTPSVRIFRNGESILRLGPQITS